MATSKSRNGKASKWNVNEAEHGQSSSITKILNHEEDEEITRSTTTEVDPQASNPDLNVTTSLKALERQLLLKIDLRLCTISGLLCSLTLLDSSLLASASVTSMLSDLNLTPSLYSLSILIFTLASIAFQLPCTIAVRHFGPRRWFASITIAIGVVTMCTAFIRTWKEMVILRVLLGAACSGMYLGLTYLISIWYLRSEQQLRFAFLQTGQCIILSLGGILNWGINERLDGKGALQSGWRYMFLVQGLVTILLGIVTYFWIVEVPENAHRSYRFLTKEEQEFAVERLQKDRKDVVAPPFSWKEVLRHATDLKIYGFACIFFLVNIVSTSLAYFLPIILQQGMGFSENKAILLSAPPYFYAVIPVLISSFVGDRYRLRGPVIIFNSLCVILGFSLTGFSSQVTLRYIGTFLSTGAYISNWAAVSAYQANNIAGQWKRVFTAAAIQAMNGAGGIAGSFIVRKEEAPRYGTAVWVAIGSHLGIVGLVGAFSAWFGWGNRGQRLKGRVLEETVGFRYTY